MRAPLLVAADDSSSTGAAVSDTTFVMQYYNDSVHDPEPEELHLVELHR